MDVQDVEPLTPLRFEGHSLVLSGVGLGGALRGCEGFINLVHHWD